MNLGTSDQTIDACGTSAVLIVIASNTAGIPIHQDDAAPSAITHQSRNKKPPRKKVLNQRVLIEVISICLTLVERVLQIVGNVLRMNILR